jgi:hypothetical protein
MAETYDATCIHQFNNGKVLIESLDVRRAKPFLTSALEPVSSAFT